MYERDEEEILDLDVTSNFKEKEEEEEVSDEIETPSEEELFSIAEEETKSRISDDESDWYDEEQTKIKKELEENYQKEERKIFIKNEEKKEDNKYILQGLSFKWLINPQIFIEARKDWKTIYDFLNFEKNGKKWVETMFYANALTPFLWENYLERYLVSDLLFYLKNRNKSLIKELQNTKIEKEFKKGFKKYLSGFKFKKVSSKVSKKDKQNGLLSETMKMQSLFAWVDEKLAKASEKFLNEEELRENIKKTLPKRVQEFNEKLNIQNYELKMNDNFIPFLTKVYSYQTSKDLQFMRFYFKKLLEGKTYDTYEEKWPLPEVDETQFQEEIEQVIASVKIPERKLNVNEYNNNIQKYIDITGFMDNKTWFYLKQKYKVGDEVQRVNELNKFISKNDEMKLSMLKKIMPEYDYTDLITTVLQHKKIEELRLEAKKELLWKSLDEIIDLLGYGIAKKEVPWVIGDIIKRCQLYYDKEMPDYHPIKRLGSNLKILYEARNLTDEQKKTITISDSKKNENGEYEKIQIIFKEKVKSILIELFIIAVNFYLKNAKKDKKFKEKYYIKAFGFLMWKSMFQKNKALLYLREKWEYVVATYGMVSNLFNKLRWLWTLTMSLNWNWDEKIEEIKYLTLSETIFEDLKENAISPKELWYFRTFKKKVVTYWDYLWWAEYLDFQNTVLNLWKSQQDNSFLFFHYDNEHFYFFDWEISVKFTQFEFKTFMNMNADQNERKDFINTSRVLNQEMKKNPYMWNREMFYTTIQWVDIDGKIKKDNIFTNLTCNVGYWDKTIKDYFEDWVHRGLLAYYCLYYKSLFDKNTKQIKIGDNSYKGIIVFDLETIWFTGNIILSYFLYVWYDTVYLLKYSHPEFKNFFDRKDIAEGDFMWDVSMSFPNLEKMCKYWIDNGFLISWHNILSFDNKKMVEDITQDKIVQTQWKEKLDRISLDTLDILMQAGYGRLWLDFLSKINFDFGKNIKKWDDKTLMDTILLIQNIINLPEWERKERIIKKEFNTIHKFIAYNKNDVLMSMGLLGQLIQYWMLATGKKIAKINIKEVLKQNNQKYNNSL